MNDLTQPQFRANPLLPATIDEAKAFAKLMSMSDLVPKDFQGKEANIFVAVQWGFELGLHPMQAMQSIAVINGRPSIWGDAVLALVRASGECEAIREDIGDDAATCTTTRKGEAEVSRTFTKADAVKAGLWGKAGPWTTYPKRMLQMRARSWCLRDVYPDVLRGVHVAEESQDIEKDVTPAPEVSASVEIQQPKPKGARPATVDAELVTEHAKKADPAPAKIEAPKAVPPKASEEKAGDFSTPASAGMLAHVRKKAEVGAIAEAEIINVLGLVDGDGEPRKSLDGASVGTVNLALAFLCDPAGYRPK